MKLKEILESFQKETLNTDKLMESSKESKEKCLEESAPPGMEDWVLNNKKRFIDQYGKEKGEQILYATAWKLANKE